MKTVLTWFAKNSVTANLLMGFILISGFMTIFTIKQEVFPEISADRVVITVMYLGAAPEEVEEGVCIRIEEEIQSLDGIKKITSVAMEGVGSVTVEAVPNSDLRRLLDDIKTRVDGIDTFPEETEKPVVSEVLNRKQVVTIAVSGDVGERVLKSMGEQVRDDLLQLPEITQIDLVASRPYEISIEVSEKALRRYGMTFDEVARAVRLSSLDLPGGSIKSDEGEMLLRAKGQAYNRHEFENVTLRAGQDGSRVALGDVAQVIDGFSETDQSSRFDRKPTVMIKVFSVGDEGAIEVADAAKSYVDRMQNQIPEGLNMTVWGDESRILRDRLDLLLRNARSGLALVFITLALFLRFRLAFWVALGIPISFCGALWIMPFFDASINMITLFAFIVVIGIVVDDAIVVGENIYSHIERGKTRLQAAIDGVQEVAKPVIFAVLTSIAAFYPLLNVDGNMGKVFRYIPIIVIGTLAFSLVESLLILPAHLSHMKIDDKNSEKGRWRRFQAWFDDGLKNFIERIYRPWLDRCLRMRYIILALSVTLLMVTIGLALGGWLKFTFFPKVEADNIVADLTMPQGSPVQLTRSVIDRLESAALQLDEEFRERNDGKPIIRHMLTSIGEQPSKNQGHGPAASSGGSVGAHLGEIDIELFPGEQRKVGSVEVSQRWRELVGAIPDVEELIFTSSLFSAGDAINVQFASKNYESLQVVTDRLKKNLADYPGVFDISDSFKAGKKEIKLGITPVGESLGLTLSDLARQVRQAFYGEEAQRIQRKRDDVRVMIRYPADERRSIHNLENMRIRLPDGTEVPFSIAATAETGRGYASINRTDRQRTINVIADLDETVANANEIMSDLKKRVLPKLLADYPSVSYSLEGEQREQKDSMRSLVRGFLFAILLIYILLAIPFKSYIQPLIVMSAIPFGLVGAIWGHVVMGVELSILSMMGIVALTGVVVNDSLVLVDYINRYVASGHTIIEAIKEAGAARFRPILLTSVTTFAGLTPLLLERSLQAQFMIPMAISLAYGVIFATVITLILVPVGYQILEDMKKLWII
ncbi:MAG: hypothetical protein B6244_14030 [Candidatus Cloacimonetes bacterium 4572_55]|nr:MAG: hypothetical protein B6244_14030 [Candidatus Cloacimonetes bacterium 4572_55]